MFERSTSRLLLNYNNSKKKAYYYKCIDNCKICKKESKCYQYDPEYRLNDEIIYEKKIEGCGLYDNGSAFFDHKTNNNGTGYNICKKCDEFQGYYCFGSKKGECKKILDNKIYFNNYFWCKEKCEDSFANC